MAPGGAFASASLFALKAKLFNDELYASVERFCQIDNPTCAGKARMLADLLTELQDRRATDTVDETTANEAIAGILAAVQLGGLKPKVDRRDAARALRLTKTFLADELASKPIGFYSHSNDLAHIFQQDRMLQQPIEPDPARLIGAVLKAEDHLHAAYLGSLSLAGGMSGTLVGPNVLDALDATGPGELEYKFLPPSRSHEMELGKELFGDQEIPDGFDLIFFSGISADSLGGRP